MMENAGRAVADTVEREFREAKKIIIIAGLGNNGGDGMVAARHLANRGFEVEVHLISEAKDIRTDNARINWSLLEEMSCSVPLHPSTRTINLDNIKHGVEKADVVVDAMLGTGVTGALREPYKTFVELVNDLDTPVIAIDIPTGLDPTTGEAQGTTIKATHTVALHKAKHGLLEAKDYVGKLTVADIGIPLEAEIFTGPGDAFLASKEAKKGFKKGRGKLLVVGGSIGWPESPLWTAMGAMGVITDKVVLAIPETTINIVESWPPSLSIIFMPGQRLNLEHTLVLREALEVSDAYVWGLEEEGESFQAFCSSIEGLSLPGVICDPALEALNLGLPTRELGELVLTSKVQAFSTQRGVSLTAPLEELGLRVAELAREMDSTILLKGREDVISDGERVKFNRRRHPKSDWKGYTEALAGVVGSYLTMGVSPFKSAIAAAYIVGLASDLIHEEELQMEVQHATHWIRRAVALCE